MRQYVLMHIRNQIEIHLLKILSHQMTRLWCRKTRNNRRTRLWRLGKPSKSHWRNKTPWYSTCINTRARVITRSKKETLLWKDFRRKWVRLYFGTKRSLRNCALLGRLNAAQQAFAHPTSLQTLRIWRRRTWPLRYGFCASDVSLYKCTALDINAF